MAKTLSVLLIGAMLCNLLGCTGAGRRMQREVLEARLRDSQDLAYRHEQALARAEVEQRLARDEADMLRHELAKLERSPLLPEQADVLLRAESLAFHTMMTGARDADGRPGDDNLNIVLVPYDRDGEPVKLAGAIKIEVLDPARDAAGHVLGEWTYSPQEARDHWHKGFLASGFLFDLPLPHSPRSEQIVLQAHLQSPDGREFHTVHQLKVKLPDEPFANDQLAESTTTIDSATPGTLSTSDIPGRATLTPGPLPVVNAAPLGHPVHEYPQGATPTDSVKTHQPTPSVAPVLRPSLPVKQSRDQLESVPFVLDISSTVPVDRISNSRMPTFVPPETQSIPNSNSSPVAEVSEVSQPDSPNSPLPTASNAAVSPPVRPDETNSFPTSSSPPNQHYPTGHPRSRFGRLPSRVVPLTDLYREPSTTGDSAVTEEADNFQDSGLLAPHRPVRSRVLPLQRRENRRDHDDRRSRPFPGDE
ncbi:MAG: hypothetical protein R3C01_06550 [Planctomycetaceae bacterium]